MSADQPIDFTNVKNAVSASSATQTTSNLDKLAVPPRPSATAETSQSFWWNHRGQELREMGYTPEQIAEGRQKESLAGPIGTLRVYQNGQWVDTGKPIYTSAYHFHKTFPNLDPYANSSSGQNAVGPTTGVPDPLMNPTQEAKDFYSALIGRPWESWGQKIVEYGKRGPYERNWAYNELNRVVTEGFQQRFPDSLEKLPIIRNGAFNAQLGDPYAASFPDGLMRYLSGLIGTQIPDNEYFLHARPEFYNPIIEALKSGTIGKQGTLPPISTSTDSTDGWAPAEPIAYG